MSASSVPPLRILIVDDQPIHFKPYLAALNTDGYVTHWARDLTEGWAAIQAARTNSSPQYSLILIDMLLERKESAFSTEQIVIDAASSTRNKASFPSGQCLGLRLWHQRKTLKLPYAYVTNHLELWMPQLTHPSGQNDPEFGGANQSQDLISSKSDWSNTSCITKVNAAIQAWKGFF